MLVYHCLQFLALSALTQSYSVPSPCLQHTHFTTPSQGLQIGTPQGKALLNQRLAPVQHTVSWLNRFANLQHFCADNVGLLWYTFAVGSISPQDETSPTHQQRYRQGNARPQSYTTIALPDARGHVSRRPFQTDGLICTIIGSMLHFLEVQGYASLSHLLPANPTHN